MGTRSRRIPAAHVLQRELCLDLQIGTCSSRNRFRRGSTVLPIKQIPHRLTSRRVRAFVRLPSIGSLRPRIPRVLLTARRTPIRKPRLPRPQLKLFTAHHASFDRICWHLFYFIAGSERVMGQSELWTVPFRWRHPEGPRFLQRAEGSRADHNCGWVQLTHCSRPE